MENENSQLAISGQGKMYLLETAKWAKFLAIITFVFLGLAALGGIFMIAMHSLMPAPAGRMMGPLGHAFFVVYGLFLLIIVAIAIIPTYYLYQFAVRTQAAVVSNDEVVMTESLGWLKKRFKFIGVMTIVVLCFYVLMIIIGVIVSLTAGLAAMH